MMEQEWEEEVVEIIIIITSRNGIIITTVGERMEIIRGRSRHAKSVIRTTWECA